MTRFLRTAKRSIESTDRSSAIPSGLARTSVRLALALAIGALLSIPTAARSQGTPVDEWGSGGTGPGQFDAPQGLHASDRFQVYVADTGNHRIQVFDTEGTFLFEFGAQGSGNGQFESPWDVGVDWDENVYVADFGNHRIQKFDAAGGYLGQWGGQGSGTGQFESPTGVELNPDIARVYVLDSGNARVQVFDLDGNYLFQWGGPGGGASQFSAPEGIAMEWLGGPVVVADTGNHRVQVFGLDGSFVTTFGSAGTGDGQFQSPKGVGIDCVGKVYVADTGNDRIQQFDQAYGFVEVWAPPGSGPGQVLAPTGVERIQGLIPVGKDGTEAAGARAGHGVSSADKIALEGLFVSDAGNDRIQVIEGPCCGGGFCFPDGSSATTAGGTLRISPAGNGNTLAEIGATVTVQLVNCCGDGIWGFPFQDLWLDDQGSGDISLCQGGSVADANTDVTGTTTFSGKMYGGGYSEDGLYVYASGVALFTHPLDIRVNSADINGDRVVDLSDVGAFASDLLEPVAPFRSDLSPNGVIDLSDVGLFAAHVGEECP